MFNACLQRCKIPGIWRKAKIIAILKPGKEANNPNDRAITSQGNTFEEVEQCLSEALRQLDNQLKPNPTKTQTCAFHLRNRQAGRHLHIEWKGVALQHYRNPKYLGVTLDRAHTYKQHRLNTKLKPTPLDKIHLLAGIAPPAIRREAVAYKERIKSAEMVSHPLHGQQPTHQRLKSRRSLLKSTEDYLESISRLDRWKKNAGQDWMEPKEEMAPGCDESWETWRAMNRLRTGLDPESNWKLYMFITIAGINAIAFCHCGQVLIDDVLLKTIKPQHKQYAAKPLTANGHYVGK
nr:unnamed protein product [Callosobruchus analis]